MDTRQIKALSDQELIAVRRSENAVSLYVGTVTEIETYRNEGRFDLADKAMPVFVQMRNEWLSKMLPKDRQKMMQEVDTRIGYQPAQVTPGTLFQKPAPKVAPAEVAKQSQGCRIL